MINPLVLYTAGGALLIGALGGWTVRDWKADSDQLAAVERANEAEKAAIAAVYKPSEGYEQVLADLRPREIETRNTIREVYRDVEVPADCAVPPAGGAATGRGIVVELASGSFALTLRSLDRSASRRAPRICECSKLPL